MNLTNQKFYSEAGTYNGLFVKEIVGRKIEPQDSYSNDNISVISDSDSDILETLEKADFIEFLDNNSSTLAGFEEELST